MSVWILSLIGSLKTAWQALSWRIRFSDMLNRWQWRGLETHLSQRQWLWKVRSKERSKKTPESLSSLPGIVSYHTSSGRRWMSYRHWSKKQIVSLRWVPSKEKSPPVMTTQGPKIWQLPTRQGETLSNCLFSKALANYYFNIQFLRPPQPPLIFLRNSLRSSQRKK